MDIAISFPGQGQIRLQSRDLFAEPGNETCRQFLERVFQAPEITDVTINSHQTRRDAPRTPTSASALDRTRSPRWCSASPPAWTLGGETTPRPISPRRPSRHGKGASITRVTPVRNEKGQVRFFRYGSVVTNWEVKHEIPGRLRIKNPLIHRKGDLCQAIERELMSVLGVDSYKTNPADRDRAGPVRPEGADPRPDHRDHRKRPGRGRSSAGEGPARPPSAALHGLDAVRRRGPVRRAGALARGRGALRLHLDSHLQGGPRGARRGEAAGGRRPRRDRRPGLPGDDVDLPRRGALLVPELRPGAGEEDAGQLQEAAPERLRQAAPVRLALSRRRRGAGLARPARRPETPSSSTPARSCRSTGSSPRAWR